MALLVSATYSIIDQVSVINVILASNKSSVCSKYMNAASKLCLCTEFGE